MSSSKIYRLLDASSNRACEAVRVVEDVARFILDDRLLTSEWKEFRHHLVSVLCAIPRQIRAAVRETESDVGTSFSLSTELQRENVADLIAANIARLQQSLRSLEEGAKIVAPELASQVETLRYRSYTLASAMEGIGQSNQRLGDVRLYVLVAGCGSRDEFSRLIDSLLLANVGAIQLRDKLLADADLLDRARLLVEKCRGRRVFSIINDRPDIAVLAGADGVHVGQTDLAVKDARQIVGPHRLVGVSTHNAEQVRRAVLDGANYAGIGPVFPSNTKSFSQYGGLSLVQQVATNTTLPLFAIGGINTENAEAVIQAGASRLAVGSAVTTAADPNKIVALLKEMLQECDAKALPSEATSPAL